ncbi:hypothetical protein D3C81_1590460 [compost metagenome]
MDGPEQGAGRPFRIASALLPIAQRADSDIDLLGEFCLGESGRAANLAHLHRVDVELTRGLAFAADDLVHLRDAFQQFVEEMLVHGYLHFSITWRSTFFWSLVRSSCSPFG